MDGDRVKRHLRTIAVLLFALPTGASFGAPYHPASDDVVLERVAARSDLERLAPLRSVVTARPDDLNAALALATGYIEVGRRNSDPRFIAYAQATLLPWVARSRPPERVLVLQAIALQYLHEFDGSLRLLDRALALEPLDAQAWLTRAALLELRGDYPEARRSCARLVRSADELTALTCMNSVASRNGQLEASYATLRSLGGDDPRIPAVVHGWMLAVLAEMAERLGDDRTAETDLRQALEVTPEDPYLKASYADLLLRLDRPREVIRLLRGNEAQDPLLLRLAIAGHRIRSPEAARWAALCAERIRAAERDRDYTHQREQAMYLLEVGDDPSAALKAAASNWAVQREPADLRIYARSAQRADSGPDQEALRAWLRATHYEDHTLGASALLPPTRAP